jgi:hypothetical protein
VAALTDAGFVVIRLVTVVRFPVWRDDNLSGSAEIGGE